MADAAPDVPLEVPDAVLTGDPLRRLSRSPHPYQRHQTELTQYDDGFSRTADAATPAIPLDRTTPRSMARTIMLETDEDAPSSDRVPSRPAWRAIPSPSTTTSDSGTDADDEHYLKGLPAPRLRPHKGLRDRETLSRSPSPRLSPLLEDDRPPGAATDLKRPLLPSRPSSDDASRPQAADRRRRARRIEIIRRATEVVIIGAVGVLVLSPAEAAVTCRRWKSELISLVLIVSALLALYPLRLLRAVRCAGLEFPPAFDPAPLFYPLLLPIYVSICLSPLNPGALPANIVLSIATLPATLVPRVGSGGIHLVHWLLTCVPLHLQTAARATSDSLLPAPELLSVLYPLHQSLCVTLRYLTTTSLLTAEVELLSVALINLLLLAASPQAVILKALLWIGGLGVFVSCRPVLRWGVALARVPKWRFRRAANEQASRHMSSLRMLYAWFTFVLGRASCESDEELQRPWSATPCGPFLDAPTADAPPTSCPPRYGDTFPRIDGAGAVDTALGRRHAVPHVSSTPRRSGKTTPSGRKKRAASSSTRYYFSLTPAQATVRKWLYAGYVYACVLGIVLVTIRSYVGSKALGGQEAVGWGLGYVFGGVPWFRMEVIKMNLERWICLPPRLRPRTPACCQAGWVEHLRSTTFGAANTRLLLAGYWGCVMVTGLAIVFRLSTVVAVDTRRKVFHFMMVAILLPATYVDPAFAALALMLMLAVFLLLDMFRAAQLPPLAQPLAVFLAPYVDGRDLKGPVVISHIFLLIGCAMPLWLSLGRLPRSGTGPLAGWEVPSRDVSMVSGVICVGMGDAAASLIGRRFGRHKWLWPGGKSVEGSVAFATAVAVALVVAKGWLRVGGWPESAGHDAPESWLVVGGKAVTAASLASMTEAVLTGGNDNVVVPVVLWLCVQGLGL